MSTPSLSELRTRAEASAEQAKKDMEALTAAAVAASAASVAYGHHAAVARESGINQQVLRELVEKRYPGHFARAAAERKAAKAAKQ
jgi:hypothetical protein